MLAAMCVGSWPLADGLIHPFIHPPVRVRGGDGLIPLGVFGDMSVSTMWSSPLWCLLYCTAQHVHLSVNRTNTQ